MSQTLAKTRAEAAEAGAKLYFTGIPCKNGHVRPRRVSNCVCLGCNETQVKSDRARENERLALRAWRKTPAGRAKMIGDRAKFRATEKGKQLRKAAARAYMKTDKGRAMAAAKCARRRSQQKLSSGISREIRGFYEMARRVSLCTGIPHEVDHIHPLRGRGFSGLHVPWNLRVVSRAVNVRKSNRLEAA